MQPFMLSRPLSQSITKLQQPLVSLIRQFQLQSPMVGSNFGKPKDDWLNVHSVGPINIYVIAPVTHNSLKSITAVLNGVALSLTTKKDRTTVLVEDWERTKKVKQERKGGPARDVTFKKTALIHSAILKLMKTAADSKSLDGNAKAEISRIARQCFQEGCDDCVAFDAIGGRYDFEYAEILGEKARTDATNLVVNAVSQKANISKEEIMELMAVSELVYWVASAASAGPVAIDINRIFQEFKPHFFAKGLQVFNYSMAVNAVKLACQPQTQMAYSTLSDHFNTLEVYAAHEPLKVQVSELLANAILKGGDILIYTGGFHLSAVELSIAGLPIS
ncbi:hypothetical protein COS70_00850 [Candidatus Micrarchaeota archaeon CG06_land_8_20_14_3_00_50_6]|nr:MAG: hypothetical protein COS70_00850 [Candidatus Micrarchaeota archaeon CG06_land_8_20_14_3_00_50_6]